MGKRGRILMAVSALIVAGIIAWAFFAEHSVPPEPVYKGKPLSYWLQGYDPMSNITTRPNSFDADAAMYHAGTNAIPTLLRMVRAQDSLKNRFLIWAYNIPYLRRYYPRPPSLEIFSVFAGFQALHQNAAPAIPELIKNLNGNPDSSTVRSSISILGQMGPAAAAAVPALLRISAGNNQYARMGALSALGEIQSDREKVVPVLIAALHDPSTMTRAVAAGALRRFGFDAMAAVPALVQIISEPDGGSNSVPAFPGMPSGQSPTVRSNAKEALLRIDPDTYNRVVTNSTPTPKP